MGPKLFGILCVLCGLAGCDVDESLGEPDEVPPLVGGGGGGGGTGGDDSSGGFFIVDEDHGSGFDPCPDVTYILRDPAGNPIVVVIDVFCEPMQDMNLGCPGPSY